MMIKGKTKNSLDNKTIEIRLWLKSDMCN